MDSDAVIVNEIDYDGLWEFLTVNPDCMFCDMQKKRADGTRCSPCMCRSISKATPRSTSRVGISYKVKTRFNVPKVDNHGKHHAYFFSYYKDVFEFCFPEVPGVCVLGNSIEDKMLRWNVHHINGDHNDDRKENLGLCLSTEHTKLHNLNGQEKEELIQKIKDRNRSLFGTPCWGDEE